LAAELLACKIRQDKEIQGIKIFVRELKLSQFAHDIACEYSHLSFISATTSTDDTTLLNSNCNSVNKAIAVLDNFGDISGPKIKPIEN